MMKTLTHNLMFIVALFVAVAGNSIADDEVDTSLSEAVAAFNKKSLSDTIGAAQPPMTEEEVVAAILLYECPPNEPVSDELLGSFKKIATSKTLPENASFESLNGYDRGGSHIFDVWSVRIRMERADGSSYAFVLRERVVGSRTLEEELERLNNLIEEEDVKRWVGGYRILERKKDLEARILKGAE